MKLTVGVLYGGRSGEHDVSRCSAASVVDHLDREKYDILAIGIDRDGRWYVQDSIEFIDDEAFGRVLALEKRGQWSVNHFESGGQLVLEDRARGREERIDVIFPVVHGTFCEDGTLQGLLALSMVPHVGPDVLGAALGMDKDVAKRLLRDADIPVVPWKVYDHSVWEENRHDILEELRETMGFPCFVKPCSTGSSVGISKVEDSSALGDAIDRAFQWDWKVMVEQGIEAREVEFAVLGNEMAEVSVPGEIRPKHAFYSYEAKYVDSEGAELIIPAHLEEGLAREMSEVALEAYRVLCCSSMARIDFFVDKKSNIYYLNEINTLPGFTTISMYPKLWEKSGLEYGKLLDKLIELAFQRDEKKRLCHSSLGC